MSYTIKVIAWLAVFALSGCATTMYRLNAPCTKFSKAEIMQSITSLVLQEGLNIKQSDERIGYILAESEPSALIYPSGTMKKVWSFSIVKDTVVASAKTIIITTNAFGATTGTSETYYADHVHHDWLWYWNVRNGLQSLCGSLTITERKVQ